MSRVKIIMDFNIRKGEKKFLMGFWSFDEEWWADDVSRELMLFVWTWVVGLVLMMAETVEKAKSKLGWSKKGWEGLLFFYYFFHITYTVLTIKNTCHVSWLKNSCFDFLGQIPDLIVKFRQVVDRRCATKYK